MIKIDVGPAPMEPGAYQFFSHLQFQVLKSFATCPFGRCLVIIAYGKVRAYVYLFRSTSFMSLVPDTSKPTMQDREPSQKRSFVPSSLHLPRNAYFLLLFTTGRAFELTVHA